MQAWSPVDDSFPHFSCPGLQCAMLLPTIIFNYMLESDIFRHSTQIPRGVQKGDF